MIHTKKILSFTASMAAYLSTGQPSLAEDGTASNVTLEEVTITAEKREGNVQRTAISVVALSGEDIESEGRDGIRDVLSTVGGVSFSNGGLGAIHINMRGIEGSTALAGRTDAGVSLNFDGIVLSNLVGDASSATFYDIARVEVLRGPQGTLYGRGAEAGAVNIITNNPGKTFELGGTLELGNYRLQHLGGMINLPLGDSWALRAAYNGLQRASYYSSGLDAADISSSRVKLRYDGGGSFTALLGAELTLNGGSLGSGVAGSGIPSWGRGDPPVDAWDDVTKDGGLTGVNPGSTQDYKLVKIWSQLDWNTAVGDLTLIPGYASALNKYILISTATTPQNALIANQYVKQLGMTDADAKSIEARFASPAESAFKWVIGAYYDTATAFIYNGQFTRNIWQDQSSLAGFAQATLPLGEKWSVTAGLRQTKDEKSYSTERTTGALNHSEGEMSWSRTDWKLGVEHQLTSDSMLYFTAATGYRPGGVDTGAADTVTTVSGQVLPNNYKFSKPEYLTTFEIGSKNELFNKRLRLNGDVFLYNYKDPQFMYFTATADPTSNCPNGAAPVAFGPDVTCAVMLNAAAVRTVGAEMDALWLWTEHDRINLSLSYLSAKVAEHQIVALSIPPGAIVPAGSNQSGANILVDVKGARTPRSPKSQANAYYEHDFNWASGLLSLRGDVHYMGETYLSGFNYLNPVIRSGIREGDRYVISANTRYDASLKFEAASGKWSVNLYGRNLTNEAVKSFTTGDNNIVDPPRTVGIVLTAKM